MKFLEMNPDHIRTLLDQRDENGNLIHQDVLSGEVRKEEALFKRAICPACKSNSTEPFVDVRRPFLSGSVLPNRLLRCLQCRTEFDPYSGLIVRSMSSPA